MAPHSAGGTPSLKEAATPGSSRRRSVQDASCSEQAGRLFALLLNTETKDEGEEYLDYCYPADDPELQAVALMKGVLLASVGVMKAASGQEVSFFAFRSTDGQRHYKAALLKVERWILCVIVRGAVSDRVASFLAEEASGLAALRHGRVTSLQGNFRQLDPIFRALEGVWRCGEHRLVGAPEREANAPASLLYLSLGVVLWNPLVETLRQEVGHMVAEWERKWRATAQDPPLATPEACALFLDQELVSTSLSGSAFEACLRLCLLEGALHAGAIATAEDEWDGGVSPAKCHSLFLEQRYGADAEMPSHQYGVLRRGPWILFMLWRMTSLEAQATPKGVSKKTVVADDPFGIDLCVELLNGMPMPSGYNLRSADARAARAVPKRRSASASTASKDSLRRSFGLPCGVFKSSSSRKAKKQGSGSLAQSDEPQSSSFLHALELAAVDAEVTQCACGSVHTVGFTAREEPRRAAHDSPRAGGRLICPEMAARVASRQCAEWPPAGGSTEVLREWADLQWLAREHARRRASWRLSPSLDSTRHPLQAALKGKQTSDRLWEDSQEQAAEGDGEAAGANGERKRRKNPNATLLGSGEPWRFQEGAPMHWADLPSLTSAGCLLRPQPQPPPGETTPASRAKSAGGEHIADAPPRAHWVAIAAKERQAGGGLGTGTLDADGVAVLLHTDCNGQVADAVERSRTVEEDNRSV